MNLEIFADNTSIEVVAEDVTNQWAGSNDDGMIVGGICNSIEHTTCQYEGLSEHYEYV